MTSKIVVNNIEADAGVSTVFFNSDIGATDGTLNVDGNLTVDGVITYEDVTNVDSVGIVTARSGLHVTGGSVGIGTDNPTQKLDVIGGNVRVGKTSNGKYIAENNLGQSKVVIDSSGTSYLNGGNVGIGTDNPSDKLSIYAPPNSLVFGAKDTTRGNHIFQLLADDAAGNGEIRLYQNSGSGTHTKTVEIASSGNSYFTGGNVGINDTSPDNKLHITTTSSSAYSTNTTNTSNLTNALLKLQNLDGSDGTGANNYVGIQFSVANGATSTAQMQYVRTGDNAGKFVFKARNTASNYPNIMTLLSSGNLGIGGLTNPGALLSIPAGESNTPRLAIESAVDDNDFTITQYEDGNGTYTMLGQNVKLNSGGNNTILDSGHRTAGILLDARNHGAITFLTGGTNSVSEPVKITSAGTLESYSPDDTTPNIKWRSNDTNWYGSLNQSVEGGTITSFLSCGGDWSASGTTYSATKALAAYPTSAIAIHNQYNSSWGSEFVFLTKAGGSSTTDGAVTEKLRITEGGHLVYDTNKGGIYNFDKACSANASTNIFRIDNEHGAHCFTIYMTGSNSGNSVSKIYHVACKYGATPTINSAADTGAYGSNNFSLTGSASGKVHTFAISVTGAAATISCTVVLGSMTTSATVTVL